MNEHKTIDYLEMFYHAKYDYAKLSKFSEDLVAMAEKYNVVIWSEADDRPLLPWQRPPKPVLTFYKFRTIKLH
jgi:hypothetical protein